MIDTVRAFTTAILSSLLAIAAYSQTVSDPYTWTPVIPALTVPRADACAAALADGSAIVSGGITTGGSALASVDLFQVGVGFSSAPAMNNARAAHSCTTLKDGRVLVVGGNDGLGNPIGTAEIYDPAAQSWTVAADLNDPRWGHTATLLKNGRVLIAGGQDGGGPKDTLELFEPKASTFISVPVRLSSPRMNLAAALLPDDPDGADGLVAFIGGMSFNGASASVDLFNPAKNTIIAAAPLRTARASHTANSLSDGTILVAGGWDGTQDVGPVEIYDVQKGSAWTLGNMNTPRHGHFAITLPGNGNVLLGAGFAGASALASCELYSPANGTFSAIGSLASPRARTTAVPVGGGMVLSAGGVSTDGLTPINSTGLLTAPTITWNLVGLTDPYEGDLSVHGKNFRRGDKVTFQLETLNTGGKAFQTLNSITTTDTSFDTITNSLMPPERSGTWALTVESSLPPVTVKQPVVFANVALSSSCNPCVFGLPATLTAKITNSDPRFIKATPAGGDEIVFMDGNTTLGKAKLNATSGAASASFALASGTHQITANIGANAGGLGGTTDGFLGQSSVLSLPFNVVQIPAAFSLSANPDPVVAGTPVTLSAVVSFDPVKAGPLKPTGIVTYEIEDNTTGLIASAQAPVGQSVTVTAPAPGTYAVSCNYSGDDVFFFDGINQANLVVTPPPSLSALTPFYGSVQGVDTPTLQWRIVPVTVPSTLGQPISFSFGNQAWIPVTGDWAGFGQSAVGAYDPATDTWHLAGPPAAVVTEQTSFQFGRANCPMIAQTGPNLAPFLGDWASIGHAGVGVYDSSTGIWCLRNSASAGPPDFQFRFGAPTSSDVPVVGDWDGNGTTTVGLYNKSNGAWLLSNENPNGGASAGLDSIVQFSGTVHVLLAAAPLPGNWTVGSRQTGLGVIDLDFETLSTLEGGVSGQFSNLGISLGNLLGEVSGSLLLK